jgi:hypothetical protein
MVGFWHEFTIHLGVNVIGNMDRTVDSFGKPELLSDKLLVK